MLSLPIALTGAEPLSVKKLFNPFGRADDVIPSMFYRRNDFFNGDFLRIKSDSGDMVLVIDQIL